MFSDKATIQQIIDEALDSFSHGRMEEAEPALRTVLLLAEESGQLISYPVANIFSLLGDLHSQKHEWMLAQTYYAECLNIHENIKPVNNVEIAVVLKRLSEILHIQGRLDEALILALKSNNYLSLDRVMLEVCSTKA